MNQGQPWFATWSSGVSQLLKKRKINLLLGVSYLPLIKMSFICNVYFKNSNTKQSILLIFFFSKTEKQRLKQLDESKLGLKKLQIYFVASFFLLDGFTLYFRKWSKRKKLPIKVKIIILNVCNCVLSPKEIFFLPLKITAIVK